MNTVVKYLRLSNEDIEKAKDRESESIRNQRKLLNDYLDEHSEFRDWERMELCDDGWSGTNFDRPGMQELLQLVKKGHVQCIVVKDFSRFGRDYLTTGNYITKVFPFMGVRFISLGDGYDSADPSSLDDLSLSFSTIIYDLYSKELSAKVKTAKERLAQEGRLPVAPFAPFGYRKDPEQPTHLLIDRAAAETVRMIFDRICAGQSTQEVARQLNCDGVLTPLQYKRSKGCSWRPWTCVAEENFWTRAAVLQIIHNECYLGRAVYGKRRRKIVGDTHTVKVPRSDWTVADNIHEAIVSEEQFYEAQRKVKAKREGKNVRPYKPLAGKVYCSCCGHAMRRNRNCYFCVTPNVVETYQCPKERIREEEILAAVLSAIHSYARLAIDLDEILSQRKEGSISDSKRRQRDLMVLQSRRGQTERLLQEIYEDFVEGGMSKERYLAQKAEISERLSQILDETEKLQGDLQRGEGEKEQDIIEKYKSYFALDTLADEHIRELLDRVTVYPDKVLQVRLNFSDELETIAEQIKGNPAHYKGT